MDDQHQDAMSSAELLNLSSASKTFVSSTVLDNVHLQIERGEIRALVGQNGSGKSTLIKILSGFHEPDAGTQLTLRGERVHLPTDPEVLHHHGIAFMHQDSSLDPSMTVLENFQVTSLRHRRPLLPCPWTSWRRTLTTELRSFGVSVDVDTEVGELAEGPRAIVSLVRALSLLGDQGGVLVLDEPTAALDARNVAQLFEAIRRVRARGSGVLLVTHDLDEVMEIADTVTVLRDGRVADEGSIEDFDQRRLVTSIVGREIDRLYPEVAPHSFGAPALTVEGLTGSVVTDLSFAVHEGEVVGVTGIAGMGQEEVLDLVYGSSARIGGSVRRSSGASITSPRDALASGMVLIPADRAGRSCEVLSSVQDNLALPALRSRFFSRGALSERKRSEVTSEAIRALDVRPDDVGRLMGELSGGNQQKAVLARWLHVFAGTRVLLLHEPTHGVDVGARHDIFQVITDAARDGASVVYVSNEFDDLARLCDRVLIMRHGRIAAELHGPAIDPAELAHVAMSDDLDETNKPHKPALT